MDRLACISLPSLGLQLVRRRLGLAETEPLAVLAADKPSSPLLQVNRAARAAGLSPGLRYGEALGIVPRLRAGVAHPDDLARARRDLAALAGGFSPRWEPCPFDQGAFWADPSGLEALYGPVEAWGRALVSALAAAGWRAVVVVGFTREGTYVLARARKRSTVVKTPEAEAQSLAAAPLTAFPLGLRSRRLLGRLGVRTWADLGGLAPEDLARRFGPDLTAEVRALRSLRSVPLQTPAAAETLVRRRRFEAPADTLDRLLPGVLEPLGEVLTLLQARGRRLASLTLVLADGEGGLRTEVVTAAEPSAEASLWHRLVALRLEGLAAVPPGLPPTAEVRLAFTDAPLPPFTGELFAPPVVRDLAAGALTLGLVGARWGAEAVVRARLADDHRPEASFRWEPSLGLRTPRPGGIGARPRHLGPPGPPPRGPGDRGRLGPPPGPALAPEGHRGRPPGGQGLLVPPNQDRGGPLALQGPDLGPGPVGGGGRLTWAPLWCKSNFSFLEGASHPEELVDRAGALGLTSLALTDRRGVYGLVRAYGRARDTGLNLIAGAEVDLVTGTRLVLLARSREGYASLCALTTRGHHGQAKGSFVLTAAQVAAGAQDLEVLWTLPDLPAPGAPDPGAPGSPEADLAILADALGDRLTAAVDRHLWVTDPGREARLTAGARRFGLSLAAVPRVLYHDPSRQELQDVLTCLRHRVRRADAGTRVLPNAEFGLVAEDEVRRRYADVPAWVDRAAELAAGCRFSLAEIAYKYPEEGVPEGHTTASWVRHLTEQGALKRYGGQVPDAVRAQVEKELVLIEDLGYAGYFLTMYEIVEFCRDQGILCQGRGSAANSAVCYCLGITAVDPVRMNLLFERFLSKERAEPPDIDLDISHRRREEVIQHMYRRYGRHRAAMVANLVRYRSRSALREVGKVLDVPEVDLDRASKLLHHHEGGLAGALTDAGLDPNLEVHQRLVALAGQLRGFPRHLSIHPGGFVLGSGSLDRLVPVEAATMEDRTVIQWDKDDIETLGLFKVDLLGLGALTHLDLAFRLLKAHHGVDLTMATIPPGDEATFDMACRGDTVGVFQIESRAQMAMLPRLRPRTYYDLVIEVSLVRPGPITGGMVHPYLRHRQGLEAVDYPHPCLEPVLAKTLGIPLFQEQVMKLAMAAADYTPGEADQLRRDMAAWRQAGRIEAHRDRLVSRMKAKGIAEEFAVRVFDQIRGFGEYGFPESHAASFALIAYDTAWLKCHYPDVFACALLNAWPMGFYSPSTILGDAQRHGLEVRPVDLLASRWDHGLEGPPRPGPPGQAPRFALRLGLRSVRGLAKADAERLRISRPRGEKPDLGLWKLAAGVSVDVWEKLAVAGALEPWGLGRRGGLWQVLDQDPAPEPLAWDRPEGPAFEALTPAQLVAWDYSAAGLSPRAHLVAPLRPALRRAKLLAAIEVAAVLDGTRVQAAGLVICRQMPGNAKGVLFVTLEDETGLMNLIVWKNTWDRYRTLLLTLPFLAVAGKVQNEAGVVHLIADSFWNPEGLVDAASFPDQSRDFC